MSHYAICTVNGFDDGDDLISTLDKHQHKIVPISFHYG